MSTGLARCSYGKQALATESVIVISGIISIDRSLMALEKIQHVISILWGASILHGKYLEIRREELNSQNWASLYSIRYLTNTAITLEPIPNKLLTNSTLRM